jgi:cytochrome oxidase Cu insertion factor (SCO1/SenC/PrrC family)
MLQFSVHSLPAPTTTSAQRTRMGRIKMLLVLAVCAAPVVASYFTFYVLRPQGRSNYGTLIVPPVSLPPQAALPLLDLQAQPVVPASLKGQWLLVTVASGDCDGRCEQHLYLQRQLREMLGKDKDRLDRVWLVTGDAAVRATLMPALSGAWVLRASQSSLANWLKPETGQALDAHLYLVDPRGDWMMRFPAEADPARIKKDLVRLLKASESWDTAGR